MDARGDSGPATGTLPPSQVRSMFDRIAGVYDVMNRVMSAGLDVRWRRSAVEMAAIVPGDRVLDVATGTGDLALEAARRVAPGGEVVGCDFSEEMLDRARRKAPAGASLRFEWADALALPYDDASFDAATVGFGVRNFADLDAGLAELARVVRPGGRVAVLEITTPTRPPLSWAHALWFDRMVPRLGRLAAAVSRGGRDGGDGTIADAYTYLPSSVKRFPGPAELAARLDRAGLEHVRWRLMAGGIVAIHAGQVRGR